MEIPKALTKLPRWILWRMEEGRKVPYTPWGSKASSTNPKDWGHLGLVRTHAPQFSGLGFVFHEDDGLVGIDLDDCFDDAREVKPWAKMLVEALSRTTYTEISPSGTGLKAWCRGKIPRALKTPITWGDEVEGAVEVYNRARYFTFTGQRYAQSPLEVADCQTIIDWLYDSAKEQRAADAPAFPEKFASGTQHNNLVRIVGVLRRHKVCEAAIEACVQIVNQEQCEIPGPPENITQLVHSSRTWNQS